MRECQIINISDFFDKLPDDIIPEYSQDDVDLTNGYIQAMAGHSGPKTEYDLTERSGDPHIEALQENMAIDIEALMDYQEVQMRALVKSHKDLADIARQFALIQQFNDAPQG